MLVSKLQKYFLHAGLFPLVSVDLQTFFPLAKDVLVYILYNAYKKRLKIIHCLNFLGIHSQNSQREVSAKSMRKECKILIKYKHWQAEVNLGYSI